MKVVAKRIGYYGLKRRRAGDVFHLKAGHNLGDWMQKLEDKQAADAEALEADEEEEEEVPEIAKPLKGRGKKGDFRAPAAISKQSPNPAPEDGAPDEI
jgi:hypothetical protein